MLKSLNLAITAENHPDLLTRTVKLLNRLAVPVLALTMERPEDSPRMHMTIQFLADREKTDRIVANLIEIIRVIHLEARKQRPKALRQPHHEAHQTA